MNADELKQAIVEAIREEAQNNFDRAEFNMNPVNDQIGNSLERLAKLIEKFSTK